MGSTSLADELIRCSNDLVDRWYGAWQHSSHPHPDISEAALKDMLEPQLKLIGAQLRDVGRAEKPQHMWKIAERLDPEKRVGEEIPIEEVVQEYALVANTVRDWIEERKIEVAFKHYSYFYQAIFELIAESVRRYAVHQAELVTKARAEYLAGVMHQLQTPLAALSMQVQIVERTSRDLDERVVGRMRRSLRRISFLVDGVLRLERFSAADVPVRSEELYPSRLIDDVVSDYEPDAADKRLRLEMHVSRTLRMSVDPDLFVDVLGNFVQNAIKSTDSGFVIIEAEESPEDVTFRVRDSGPGIPAEKKDRLFRETQPGTAGGVGIGLQIARHAAQAQGGTVGVESEEGKGSVFWLRLPRTVPSRSRNPGELNAPDSAGRNIEEEG